MSSMSLGLQAFCKSQKTESPEMAMRGLCAMFLASCKINTAPIPLKPLLKRLNISFSYTEEQPLSAKGAAFLLTDKTGFKIAINESSLKTNWRRIRFSIAHELGHAILFQVLKEPKLIASLDENPQAHEQLERVCNVAASEILMPTTLVRAALKTHDLSPNGLLTLYDKFLVSKDVLLRKIAEVIPACSVVIWKKYARNPHESNVMRVYSSYPYNLPSLRPWLPRGCTTKHIAPPIVDQVIDTNSHLYENDLIITLGNRKQHCNALATFFPLTTRKAELQPCFDGFTIPDEPLGTKSLPDSIIVFAIDKTMSNSNFIWKNHAK